jgi:hypothetical protein
MRRCTGLRPSRTSGRARETMTDMEYSRKERSISKLISTGSMYPKVSSEGVGVASSFFLAMVLSSPLDV